LFGAFKAGPPRPFRDVPLEALLQQRGVTLVVPRQYMDQWRLTVHGIEPRDNSTVQRKLGLR
jgi:hypothetical protein